MNRKEYLANWRKKNQYKVDKSQTVSKWIYRGVKESRWRLNKIYDYKLTLTNCERCHCFFRDSYDKTLHHIHDTGKYVGIYCQDCNKMFRELSLPTTGFTHIYCDNNVAYRIHVQRKGKRYCEYFSMNKYTLDQVVEYRNILYQILYII
tara:strand:- start:14 stop:460 length:447 start_codon:yes stop_codon:yes gene_type:complete